MIWLGVLLALLPGFAWVVFYLQESPRPEPKGLIAATFVTGGASAFVALTVQLLLERSGVILNPASGGAGAPAIFFLASLFVLAFIEEAFKFLAAWLNVHKDPAFTKPVDAMIYVAIAALGFATIENIGVSLPHEGRAPLLGIVYETLVIRFVGATLLHSLASGLVGYYWALMIRDFGDWRMLAFGIVLASVLHAIFNYLIIIFGSLAYTLVFVLLIGLFVLHDFEKLKVKTI
jgi:protease PrsW